MSLVLAAIGGALGGVGACSLLLDLSHAFRLSAATPIQALARAGRHMSSARVANLGRAEDLGARLAAAGQPAGLGTRDWIGLKCFVAAAMGVCGLAVVGSLPGRLPLLAALAAPVAGFVVPDYWLGRATARRLSAAGQELAPMLDLLQVTVEAGASPAAALGAVGARFTGPLAAEWRAAAAATALGTPQEQALATLARRLPSPRVRSFVDAMHRARTRGLPLAELLAREASAARHEQQIFIRERAARAGPKIQLVVAFVLVPSVMLIVAAALIAELTAPSLALNY